MFISCLDVSIYVNGTLARHTPGVGVPLRWADQSALFLGGYVEQVCVCSVCVVICMYLLTLVPPAYFSHRHYNTCIIRPLPFFLFYHSASKRY